MTLLNIISIIDQNLEEYQVLAPFEILQAHADLLLHYLNHSSEDLAVNTKRVDKQADKVS